MPGGTDVLRALKSAVKTFEDPATFVDDDTLAAALDALETSFGDVLKRRYFKRDVPLVADDGVHAAAAFVVAAWTDVLEDLPDAAGLEALGLDQDVRRAYDKVKECMKRLMSATSAVDEALATATTGRTTWRATSR